MLGQRLRRWPNIKPAFKSHNMRSIAWLSVGSESCFEVGYPCSGTLSVSVGRPVVMDGRRVVTPPLIGAGYLQQIRCMLNPPITAQTQRAAYAGIPTGPRPIDKHCVRRTAGKSSTDQFYDFPHLPHFGQWFSVWQAYVYRHHSLYSALSYDSNGDLWQFY